MWPVQVCRLASGVHVWALLRLLGTVCVSLDPSWDELREPGEQLPQLHSLDELLVVRGKLNGLRELAVPDSVHPVLPHLVQGEAAQQGDAGSDQILRARSVPHAHPHGD